MKQADGVCILIGIIYIVYGLLEGKRWGFPSNSNENIT